METTTPMRFRCAAAGDASYVLAETPDGWIITNEKTGVRVWSCEGAGRCRAADNAIAHAEKDGFEVLGAAAQDTPKAAAADANELEAEAQRIAGDLHDKVHDAAALVEYGTGTLVGWAPEESIPILAEALVTFARWYHSTALLKAAAAPGAVPAYDSVHALRVEWAFNHGCESIRLYGDDGELQCHQCRTDFLREPLAELEAKVRMGRMARANGMAQAHGNRDQRDYRRERLIVYSARLAEHSFRELVVLPRDASPETLACTYCGARTADKHDPLVHANECAVGQVLATLLHLRELELASAPVQPVTRNHGPAVESELCGLIFDARWLARDQILPEPVSGCLGCHRKVSSDGLSGHQAGCCVGAVLRRLHRMGAMVEGAERPPSPHPSPTASKKLKGEDALYGNARGLDSACAAPDCTCDAASQCAAEREGLPSAADFDRAAGERSLAKGGAQ